MNGPTGAYTVSIESLRPQTVSLPIETKTTNNTLETTWIVIHGFLSSPSSENIRSLAYEISEQRPLDQVLVLDWSSAAGSIGYAETSIRQVAYWAWTALSTYGFSKTQLNLVGHSWGSYVAAELAERAGQVNSIIAIDPGINDPSGLLYNPERRGEVDFARNSRYSWAFFESGGDFYGSTITPPTADESFVITGSNHSDAVHVVSQIFRMSASSEIGGRFRLSRLLSGAAHSTWQLDRFNDSGHLVLTGSYTAVIDVSYTYTESLRPGFYPHFPKSLTFFDRSLARLRTIYT